MYFSLSDENSILLDIYKNKLNIIGEMHTTGILKHFFYIKIYENSKGMSTDKKNLEKAYNRYISSIEKNLF